MPLLIEARTQKPLFSGLFRISSKKSFRTLKAFSPTPFFPFEAASSLMAAT
ncbi:MAG TPA: hypothetical protein VF489_10395 [Sphingobium sp.]